MLTFVVNYDPDLKMELKSFFADHQSDIKELIGDCRLVIAEKRHSNISSLLFNKRGFSRKTLVVNESQRCPSSRCKTRSTMNLEKQVKINGKDIKLDFRYDCASESVVYLATCIHCDDFYFGQTVNTLMSRCNGHRDKFKLVNEDKSALSHHIYENHLEKFDLKLENFNFGVVKKVCPRQLDRVEDYYIYCTDADTKGLNRYLVTK